MTGHVPAYRVVFCDGGVVYVPAARLAALLAGPRRVFRVRAL